MKTRVVRYWGGTDWLYSVEVLRDISDAEFARNQQIEASKKRNAAREPGSHARLESTAYHLPAPIGIMWRLQNRNCSRERALSIARRLAMNLPQEESDVIAEFGE